MNWEYPGEKALPPGKFSPLTVETWRAQVPGGWIILTVMPTTDGPATGTTFYPDPQHEWEVTAQ